VFDFDPSRMDPEALMELTRLIQQLPPDKISRMQSLMHNMAAGFDVRGEMEEFERSLPIEFREKLLSLITSNSAPAASPDASMPNTSMDVREARLTILRAVSEGRVNPEQALLLLFPN